MRQMFANYLAAPFVLGALFFLYMAWAQDSDWAPWMIPSVLGAALIYVFSPQINWWWYSRRPQDLPPGLAGMLEQFCVFYQRLDADGKLRFRQRVVLFRMGTEWMPMAWPDESIPPDVETALAAQAVTLSWHQPHFLFEQFEKVIVYPKPFPTPEYPFAHASELFAEDGCLLFSAEQVMLAFLQPGQWYNVGLHEYAKAYIATHPQAPFPALPAETIWAGLQEASGMSRERIEAAIGIVGVEPLPVAIHHYFTFPDPFRQVLPDVAAGLDRVFSTVS